MRIKQNSFHKIFVFCFVGIIFYSSLVFSNSSPPPISPEEFKKELDLRLSQTREFKFIQEQAQKMGIRVWLFGGTAAAYAHYVKWNLQREKGDLRYQEDRFDFDYTNIFRSTQDLDIVIDGDYQEAVELESLLSRTFRYFEGNKSAWEVRLLRKDFGHKTALLNNPQFLTQHSDSHSTGLIELTDPGDEERVKDLRDWNTENPHFLQDVLHERLTYYFSKNHEKTDLFIEGRNPPIFSAIRFLTKAFQYELKIDNSDLALIRKVIDEFSPSGDIRTDYGSDRLERLVTSMVRHAVNLEYALNEIQKLGLKEKLLKANTRGRSRDLKFWINKKALESKPLGEGHGPTAKELRLSILAHETNSFEAYESITRAHTGMANVFVSREDRVGENAAYGEGFYTLSGRVGARGTGLTIRFRLHPDARKDSDFFCSDRSCTMVIVTNKLALEVIPESLNLSILEYFKFLTTDGIDENDRAQLEKFKRKIHGVISASPEESRDLLQHFKNMAKENTLTSTILMEWFEIPVSEESKTPLIVDYLRQWKIVDPDTHPNLLIFGDQDSRKYGELQGTLNLLKKVDPEKENEFLVKEVFSTNNPSLIVKFISSEQGRIYLSKFPSFLSEIPDSVISSSPEAIVDLIQDRKNSHDFSNSFLKRCLDNFSDQSLQDSAHILFLHMKTPSKEALKAFLKRSNGSQQIHRTIRYIFIEPIWHENLELLEIIHEGAKDVSPVDLIHYLYSMPFFRNHDHYIFELLSTPKNPFIPLKVMTHLLRSEQWSDREDILETAVKSLAANSEGLKAQDSDFVYEIFETLALPQWQHRQDLIRLAFENIEDFHRDYAFLRHIIGNPKIGKNYVKELYTFFDKNSPLHDGTIIREVFAKGDWTDHANILETLLQRYSQEQSRLNSLFEEVLVRKEWQAHPQIIDQIISIDGDNQNEVLQKQLVHHIFLEAFKNQRFQWLLPMAQTGSTDLINLILRRLFLPEDQNEDITTDPNAIHFIEILVDRMDTDLDPKFGSVLGQVLSKDIWQRQPHIFSTIVTQQSTTMEKILIKNVFAGMRPEHLKSPLAAVLQKNDLSLDLLVAQFVLPGMKGALADATMETLLSRNNRKIDLMILNKSIIPNQVRPPNPHWEVRFDLGTQLLRPDQLINRNRKKVFEAFKWSDDVAKHPDFLRAFFKKRASLEELSWVTVEIINSDLWRDHFDIVQYVFESFRRPFPDKSLLEKTFNAIFDIEDSEENQEKIDTLVSYLINMDVEIVDDYITAVLMEKPRFHTESMIETFIENGTQKQLGNLWDSVFFRDYSDKISFPDLALKLFKKMSRITFQSKISAHYRNNPLARQLSHFILDNPEVAQNLLDPRAPIFSVRLIGYIFQDPSWPGHPYIEKQLVAHDHHEIDSAILENLINHPNFSNREEVFATLTERCLRNDTCELIFNNFFQKESPFRTPFYFDLLLRAGLTPNSHFAKTYSGLDQIAGKNMDLWTSGTVFTAIESKNLAVAELVVNVVSRNQKFSTNEDRYLWLQEVERAFPGKFHQDFFLKHIEDLEDPHQLQLLMMILKSGFKDSGQHLALRVIDRNKNDYMNDFQLKAFSLESHDILFEEVAPQLSKDEFLQFVEKLFEAFQALKEPVSPNILSMVSKYQLKNMGALNRALSHYRLEKNKQSGLVFVRHSKNPLSPEYKDISQKVLNPHFSRLRFAQTTAKSCPLKED